MRTCSYLFLMPILSQEGNGDVTNLAVRDDAVTKPVQRVARHRTRTMQVPMHFTFTIARSGCVARSLFFAPIPDCIMRCGTFLRRALRLGNLAFERRTGACVLLSRRAWLL